MSGNRVEALKTKGSRRVAKTLFNLAASPGLGTPAKAGPPRVVSLKPRISLSDLLSSTLVFANYPLRTKILVLAMASAPQQKNHLFRWIFLLAASPGLEPRLTESESAVLPLDDIPIIVLSLYIPFLRNASLFFIIRKHIF